ncbi:MAG TPA: SDR family oxidoreductase [Streptosporangiaceae bacterium]|jgi:NAD(P)-dependent dehydrogenase (short-subunit alcohol dehydrogenase family)|nr:SDR family oxidoreductase [Streptosporangiaceae bacterium]
MDASVTVAARTWFVTGSSAGLGRALVTELLARGETVAATARDPGALSGLRSPSGKPPWTARLDVTDPEQIRRVVNAAAGELGQIDVAVSNAGYALFGAAEEATEEQIERQIRTNLTGPVHLARALLPRMRAQGHGRIIQISSVGGQCTSPGMAVYHATKWGVEGFFEALAAEVKGFGIGVTIVEPGAVRTDFTGRSKDVTAALPAYRRTPAGVVRRAVEAGYLRYPGDVARMAAAIIDAAACPVAPLRLTLGSDAYRLIRDGLTARLADLDDQKDVAASTDEREVTAR